MTSTYIWAGVLLVIVILIKSPWIKGWIGEVQVNLLARLLEKSRENHGNFGKGFHGSKR